MTPIVLKGYHWPQSQLEATPADGVFYLGLNMSSACNYRCPYCFVGLDNLRPSGAELAFHEKERVIHEAFDCGAKVLTMPGRGEPLADPDFWEILDSANRLGMWVVVYTNGHYLDREKIARLRESGVSLYVKVDSFDRNIYEAMVGKPEAFDRVRENLDMLVEDFHEPVEENGRIVSRLGINSVVTVKSAASIPAIDVWCAERRIFYTCRSPVKVGEAEKTWADLVGSEVHELRAIGVRYAARTFTSGTERNQCGIYRFGITVDNTGEILVCPDAREGFGRIGSIRESNLRELVCRRNTVFPPDSSSGFCFVKAQRNPEERLEK